MVCSTTFGEMIPGESISNSSSHVARLEGEELEVMDLVVVITPEYASTATVGGTQWPWSLWQIMESTRKQRTILK